MTWFRVDDGFGEHPKVDALGAQTPHALCVWLLCGNASARALTDGVVSEAMLARACSALSPTMRRSAAEALVRVGLWDALAEGWAFRDWLDHQPSREQVLAKRATERSRQSRRRATESRPRHAVTPTVTPAVSPAVTPGVSHSTPSRPVPSRPKESDVDARTAELESALTGAAWRPLVEHLRAAVGDWATARGVPLPREAQPLNEGLVMVPLAKWLHELGAVKGWEGGAGEKHAKWLIQRFYSTKDVRTVQAGYPLTWLARNPQQYTLKESE